MIRCGDMTIWNSIYYEGCILDGPHFRGREGHRRSLMIPFKRAMVVSYRLSVVTVALSLSIRPQFVIECHRRSNQQGIILDLVQRKSIHFWQTYVRKTIIFFTFSFPVTLTFRPQICWPTVVTLVQRYVSNKLEVSAAFVFWAIGGTGRGDGQTDKRMDEVQHLMRHPTSRKGYIKSLS